MTTYEGMQRALKSTPPRDGVIVLGADGAKLAYRPALNGGYASVVWLEGAPDVPQRPHEPEGTADSGEPA